MAITFIDLFAGIGGMRLAMEQAEPTAKCVFSSEIDKFACKTYEANFGEIPEGDITKISENEIPSHDVLMAGFPCQAFSIAGYRKGFSDTRGTLFFDVGRIFRYHEPKALILENVPGLLTHDKGRTFEIIIDTIREAGYAVNWEVLKSVDFGVPQNRKRLFIIALHESQVSNAEDKVSNIFNSIKKSKVPPVTVRTILEDIVDDEYTLSDEGWAGMQYRQRKIDAGEKSPSGYSLFNIRSPYTNTLVASYGKDSGKILIDRGDGLTPRRLTPRECARLQGFPDDFDITKCSKSQLYRQFGNSVTVPVVKAVCRAVIEALEN